MADYLLTFGGVPFVIDTAKVFRLDMPPAGGTVADQEPPRKHQPTADLVDELNRIIPSMYRQDFALPGDYPGRNLGAIARHDRIGPMPTPEVRIGDWYYPTGASRWSVFRGLATSSQAKAMLAATGGTSARTFTMKSVPSLPLPQSTPTNYTVQTQMRMLPPRPMAEHGNQFDGLYLITLVDDRWFFPGTPVSLRVFRGTIWEDLLSELAILLGITLGLSAISAVYSTPEKDSQLWTNAEPAATLLDAVSLNVGKTVARNYDGTYNLLTPAESNAIVLLNRATVAGGYQTSGVAAPPRVAGGDMFVPAGSLLKIGSLQQAKNSVVPATINVSFPKYVFGEDPVPHFLNSRIANPRPSAWYEESYGEVYGISVPIYSGGPSVSGVLGTGEQTIHDTAKALMSGENALDPVNLSGLTSLAGQMAQDWYGGQLYASLDEEYAGTFSWNMEGLHDIVWTYSTRTRMATTRAVRSQWNRIVEEYQHATPTVGFLISSGEVLSGQGIFSGSSIVANRLLTSGSIVSGLNQFPRGVGGPSVAQTVRDQFALSGTFIGESGPGRTVSGTIVSGQTVGSGQGQPGVTSTSGTYTSGMVVGGSSGLGPFSAKLRANLGINDTFAVFSQYDHFPTQNRWRGQIGEEYILFEGTSGGVFGRIDIVYRGIDGSFVSPIQFSGARITQVPTDPTWGVNLVTHEKMSFTYPQEWTSGGIQGVNIVPQTQTVRVLDGSGITMNGIIHQSGEVNVYDAAGKASGPWVRSDKVWIVPRNPALHNISGYLLSGLISGGDLTILISGNPSSGFTSGNPYSGGYYSGRPLSGQTAAWVASGTRLDGQFVGYSPSVSGRAVPAPVYAVDPGSVSGGFADWRDSYTLSGTFVGQSGASGMILSELAATLTDTATFARFLRVDFFPTQNRWFGQVYPSAATSGGILTSSEIILFEGTSGGVILSGQFNASGYNVGIFARGVGGTPTPANHFGRISGTRDGALISWIAPDAISGITLVTHEKSKFVFPHEWRRSGINEVRVVPQTQTVLVNSDLMLFLNDTVYIDALVQTFDPTGGPLSVSGQFLTSGPWITNEQAWVVDRSAPRIKSSGLDAAGLLSGGPAVWGNPIFTGPSSGQFFSGFYPYIDDRQLTDVVDGQLFGGQLVGFSPSGQSPIVGGFGATRPVYAVDGQLKEMGAFVRVTSVNSPLSGQSSSGFRHPGFRLTDLTLTDSELIWVEPLNGRLPTINDYYIARDSNLISSGGRRVFRAQVIQTECVQVLVDCISGSLIPDTLRVIAAPNC